MIDPHRGLRGPSTRRSHPGRHPRRVPALAAAVIYPVAFVTGAIVMSFEMLGSRYLNPYFGSGIYTWAALISTVLLALTVGYFLGGASPTAPPRRRAGGHRDHRLGLSAGAAELRPGRSSNSCSAQHRRHPRRQPDLVACASCSFRSPCSACIRRSRSGCCCARRSVPAASRARSTASPPRARSSARSAPLSFSFRPSGSRAITLTLGALGLLAGLTLLALARRRAPRRRCASSLARARRAGGLRLPGRQPDRRGRARGDAQARRTAGSPISKPSTTTSSSPSARTS